MHRLRRPSLTPCPPSLLGRGDGVLGGPVHLAPKSLPRAERGAVSVIARPPSPSLSCAARRSSERRGRGNLELQPLVHAGPRLRSPLPTSPPVPLSLAGEGG